MERPSRSLWIGIAFSLGVHAVALAWLLSLEVVPRGPPPTREEPERLEVSVVLLPRPRPARAEPERREDRRTSAPLASRPAVRAETPPELRRGEVAPTDSTGRSRGQKSAPDDRGLRGGSSGGPGAARGAAEDAAPGDVGQRAGASVAPGAPRIGAEDAAPTDVGQRAGAAVDPGAPRIAADAPRVGTPLLNPQLRLPAGTGGPGVGTAGARAVGGLGTAPPGAQERLRSAVSGLEESLGASIVLRGGLVPGDPDGTQAVTHLEEAISRSKLHDDATRARTTPERDVDSVGAGDLARKQQMMERVRAAADGSTEPVFRTTVAFTVSRSTGLSLQLKDPSRDPRFDAYVLAEGRRWLERERERTGEALFEGVTGGVLEIAAFAKFLQRTDDLKASDVAGLAATAITTGLGQGRVSKQEPKTLIGAALTFSFEETTGKTQVVNFARPSYRIQARLLELH